MVRFSLPAILAIAALPQATAFQACSVSHRVVSSASAGRGARLHAVAVESPVGIPRPNAATDEKEKAGAMMDLSGVVLSVSYKCYISFLCLLVSHTVAVVSYVLLQGLKGQALSWQNEDFPLSGELRAVIPQDCFEPETSKSLGYLSVSIAGTALCTAIGASMLSVLPPENPLTWPIWAAYSAVTGTVAMGLWVLAHECGHGAFSTNKKLQDGVGYAIHSLMLVPYYSWQRSHAVHHQYTNHVELGETHVPELMGEGDEDGNSFARRAFFIKTFGEKNGMRAWGALQAVLHLGFGWPAYLLIGATGGPARGMTNHFYPEPLTTPDQPKKELFPGNWKEKVYKSDIGIAAVVGCVAAWAACNGLPQMMALYGGPLIIVNAWLVLYTWYVLFRISL
jgi:omega-6 fatty acid desaturase (delta-12 desaturase)